MPVNIGGTKIPEITYPTLSRISTVYITTDFLDDYVDILGLDSSWPAIGTNETEKQAAIYRAQVYIDSLTYVGRKNWNDQILKWPRYNAFDSDGVMVDSDQTPYDIFNAVGEAAYLEYKSSGCLQPKINPTDLTPIQAEEVGAGSVTSKTTYDTSKLVDVVKRRFGAELYLRLCAYLDNWLASSKTSVYKLART